MIVELSVPDRSLGEDVQHHDLADPRQRLRLLRVLRSSGNQLRQV